MASVKNFKNKQNLNALETQEFIEANLSVPVPVYDKIGKSMIKAR